MKTAKQLPLSSDPHKLFNCNVNDIKMKDNIKCKDYMVVNNKLISILDKNNINPSKIKELYPNFKFKS